MTLQEAVDAMLELKGTRDRESAHIDADRILLAYLRANGAEELADAFVKVGARRLLEGIGAEFKQGGMLFLPRGWKYTPDQLEAIAMWMRNPKGVMPAASQPVP